MKRAEGENEEFARRGADWVRRALGEKILTDERERALRFFEEATELAQACCLTRRDLEGVIARVMSRPEGTPPQEAAGAYFTLLVLCRSRGIDLSAEMVRELDRVDNPETIARIRAKHATKVEAGIGTPLGDDCA